MSDDANAKDAAGQAPKKVVVQSPASSSIKPSSVTQIAPAANASADAPTAAPVADGRRTIKLKPMKTASDAQSEEETVSMDRDSLEPGVLPAEGKGKDEDAETVKIEKPSKSAAAAKPVVPGAKQTIKLRPSAGTIQTPQAEDQPETKAGSSTIKVKPAAAEDAAAEVQQTKKTIRLVPKKAEPAPQPSDPTTKLEADDEQPTAALARVAAVTTKLPPEGEAQPEEPEDIDATVPAGSGASSKKTLKLRTTKLKSPSPEAATGTGAGDPGDTDTGMEAVTAAPRMAPMASGAAGADEGHVAFAIAAIVALLLLVYFSWMTLGQFGEQYLEWQSANVPGLSGTVK